MIYVKRIIDMKACSFIFHDDNKIAEYFIDSKFDIIT